MHPRHDGMPRKHGKPNHRHIRTPRPAGTDFRVRRRREIHEHGKSWRTGLHRALPRHVGSGWRQPHHRSGIRQDNLRIRRQRDGNHQSFREENAGRIRQERTRPHGVQNRRG